MKIPEIMVHVMNAAKEAARRRNRAGARRAGAFSFKDIEGVDEETVRAYFATTNAKTRRLPLLVAGQVYADLEDAMTTPGRKDALKLCELRGGMMALRRFAVLFSEGVGDERR